MSAPRIHPDTIEQVRQAADIVDVVSEHVVLKKQGRGFTGCCPFHDDKSPSFSVSPDKQFYYCFSCGAGGNVFKFLMELQQRSFPEVVLDLAQKYQVPVQTLDQGDRQALQRQLSRREKIYDVLAIATQFYQQALRNPGGEEAYRYATEARQLSEDTIQSFQIGYAPGGWQTLHDVLTQQKKIPADLAEQAGLIVPRKKGDGYYDRFRDRLMIPIHDVQGRVVGFGSRTLTDEKPKYLNSPETEVFDKGKLLFGLDKARKSIVKDDHAIVVEGYFDVIALHAAGIDNAVASMGTALTGDQIRQLLRYTESKQIILNFDADAAGNTAAERAISEVEDMAFRGDVQLRILNLPNGKDADEYLLDHSADRYLDLVEQAPLWIDWQIEAALQGQDLDQGDQFQQASEAISTILGKLPNAAIRTHYIRQSASLLSQGDTRMAMQLEEALRTQVRGQRWHGRSQKWQRPADFTLREASEAQLLRIYLHCSDYRFAIKDTLRQREVEFSLSHHRFVWREILRIEEEESVIPPELQASPHPELAQLPDDFDLVTAIQDLCTDYPHETQLIYPLLYLDERTELEIIRPQLSIQAAGASLERINCEKRCRHLLDMWESAVKTAKQNWSDKPFLRGYLESLLDEETEHFSRLLQEERDCIEELEELKRLYYQEKQHLHKLDQQRCFTMQELTDVFD
ncbi:MAG: DNA primase [Cyanobacteria bacterium P01_F01_bin.42]